MPFVDSMNKEMDKLTDMMLLVLMMLKVKKELKIIHIRNLIIIFVFFLDYVVLGSAS